MLFRKLIAVTFAAFAVLSSFAADAPERISVKSDRILVAYYTWSESGNTKYAAEQIQKVTGGELLEIKPKTTYPKDYNACLAQAQKEIRDGIRPELANEPVDFKKYDVIFIGSPNWFGAAPTADQGIRTHRPRTSRRAVKRRSACNHQRPRHTQGWGALRSGSHGQQSQASAKRHPALRRTRHHKPASRSPGEGACAGSGTTRRAGKGNPLRCQSSVINSL